MADGNSSTESSDGTDKKVSKLINFLNGFIEDRKEKSRESHAEALGHIVWKERIKPSKKTKEEEKNADNSTSKEKENEATFEFRSTEFDLSKDLSLKIAETIKAKLEEYSGKSEEREFKVNEKLPQGSYGYEFKADYDTLNKYIKSLNSLTSKDKKELITTDKNGNKSAKEGTSLVFEFKRVIDGKSRSVFFISLINFKNLLVKSYKKILLNLDKLSDTKTIANQALVIETDAFDCAALDEELFVFRSINFFYLFVPTDFLRKKINESKESIEKSIVNAQFLISYAEGQHSRVRDLFYFVSNGSKIPDKEVIEGDLETIRQAGGQGNLFQIADDGKIECSKQSAGLVLAYLTKKLGLRISDRRLLNVEASTEV